MSTPAPSSFFERIRLPGNPVADPAAVVVRGSARFTVLTTRLIRLEWSATGEFEDRGTFAFPNRAAPPPPFSAADAGGALTLDTGAVRLRYRPDGGPFTADNLAITLQLDGAPVTWAPGTPDTGNLRGTRRTLDGAAGPVTLGPGLLSRDGWAVHDDSRGVLFTPDGGWVVARERHDQQDWYFFGYGHAYTEALAEYTRFGGAIPLIPRFVLGAWWSRYWAYSADELEALVADFGAHGLPLDVLVIDMDWHTPDSWTGYTWNRELFPDPAGFLRWAHEQGLRVTLNLHPAEGVQAFEEVYPEFAAALGVDPASRAPVPFRPGNREFVRAYFELLHHPLEEQGVDFWWVDWQQGEASDLPGLDPLPWLNHLHFHDLARPWRRPMLYSRWGGLGNHRYHIGFSGDTLALWDTLAYLPAFTATASNVLYGWWSHDIGGHFGADEPELYARWVQYGALNPCLRLHSTKDPLAERRPWAFPEQVFAAARAAFLWRYQLVPYLYTMARIAADTGISLCRPLYYAYPDVDDAYLADAAYFCGDQMIAAPITRPADPDTGLAAVDVWVPPGTWIDYQTRETFTGPRWVRLLGDLERLPMLMSAGAILPLAAPARTTDAIPRDHLIVVVFPGPAGAFRLYEDDGTSLEYASGACAWTPFSMETTDAGACRLQIGPAEGQYAGQPAERGYEVRFEGTRPPRRVQVGDQEHTAWSYDAATLRTTVQVAPHNLRLPLMITVEAEDRITAPDESWNQALIQADLRRLLGTAYPDVAPHALPDAVLALAGQPGQTDALARLGGPFVQFREYITLPEAARQLGCAIVAAPGDGSAFDVAVTWTLDAGMTPETHTRRLDGLRETAILPSPFAFAGLLHPLRWAVEVAVTWRGATQTYRHASALICPTIPAWRVAVYNSATLALTPAQVANPSDPVAAVLQWRDYVADPTTLLSLTHPFFVWLADVYRDQLAAGMPLAAALVARITSAKAREVRIAFRADAPVRFWLNGQPLAEATPEDRAALPELPQMFVDAQVTQPAALLAGENTLVALVQSAKAGVHYLFGLGAAVLDSAGAVPTDLRYHL